MQPNARSHPTSERQRGTGKLEPNRTSLSASAPTGPLSTPAASPRKCSSCGASDIVHKVQGAFESDGSEKMEHSVTVEIKWLKKAADFMPHHQRRGWKLRKFQGRDAMERFICQPCMVGQLEMQREHRRKIDQELKSQQAGDSYYLAVCGE